MTRVVSVDLFSEFWQEKQRVAAAQGRYHGADYVSMTFIPGLGASVTQITPGNIPLGRLIVIGGRTGSNKTRMLWNLSGDVVMQGVDVGFLTLEVGADEASPSIASIVTQIPQRFIAAGRHYDAGKAEEATAAIRSKREAGTLGHFFSNEHTDEIRNATEALSWMYDRHAARQTRVFAIDYFGLLASSGDQRKFSELNDAVEGLIQFIKATGSLLFVASQLNRGNSLPRVQPRAEGLDSCPALERFAHMVWLIDHTRQEDEEHIRRTWLLIAKNRLGRSGLELPVEFDYRHQSVRQALPDEESRWPN